MGVLSDDDGEGEGKKKKKRHPGALVDTQKHFQRALPEFLISATQAYQVN